MKRYIRVENDKIVDLFFEYQKSKFDGTEILFDDLPEKILLINGKYISDGDGNFIFTYIDGTITEIDPYIDTTILQAYKSGKLDYIYTSTWPCVLNGHQTLNDVVREYDTLKTNLTSASTKVDVDILCDAFITYLGMAL